MPEEPAPGPARPGEIPSPKAASAVDLRRLLTLAAVVAAAAIYLFWEDVRDVIVSPKIIPRPAPAEAFLPENLIKIKAAPLSLEFTRIGAAITRMTWTAPDGRVETLVSQDAVPNRALLVRLPGREEWADREFEVIGPVEKKEDAGYAGDIGFQEIRFVQAVPGDGPRVEKTFRIYSGDRPDDIAPVELQVEIKNIPADDRIRAEGYALVLSDACGVPSDLGKDECLVTVRADRVAEHHPVRRISGAQEWPTEKERRRAAHDRGEAPVSLEWVATADKYFGLILRPDKPLTGAELRLVRTAPAAAAVELISPPPPSPGWMIETFHIYAGPKAYEVLAALPGRQQEAVNYWYFGRAVTLLLALIHHNLVPNYGIAIIIMTAVFRLILWPVTSYNLRSLVDIKLANAKLEEIDAREPPRSDKAARAAWVAEARPWEDRQRNATIGVVLPLLILLPAFLVLYYALDAGYEFHRQPFALWITDISKRDPAFILPVLMGLAMMGQMRKMSENPSKERSWILMPAAFTIMFAFFSAGLVIFWLTDTLVGWLQLAVIKRRRRGT